MNEGFIFWYKTLILFFSVDVHDVSDAGRWIHPVNFIFHPSEENPAPLSGETKLNIIDFVIGDPSKGVKGTLDFLAKLSLVF